MEQPAAQADRASPGSVIAQARAARNLTTAEVAQHLKFGTKQIEALEADDYARLPGATFVRGMIRSYAKLLQIDAEPLLKDLSRRHIPAEVTVDLRAKKIPFPDGQKRATRVYVLLTAAILLAVVAVAYEWRMHPDATGEVVFVAPPKLSVQPKIEAPSPALSVVPASEQSKESKGAVLVTVPVVPAAMPAGLKRIQLEFQQDSWVEIKQADGRILLSQLNASGARKVVNGVPPFEIVIGNAPSVRLTYDNEPVDLRPYFKIDVARLTLE